MIFLCVGTQLPFDRLVKSVDEISLKIKMNVFGQIGQSNYRPKNFEFVDFLNASEFNKRFVDANVIISHAGIGGILLARRYQKPIILMPRVSAFNEHRNDHQLATVKQLANTRGIYAALTTKDLEEIIFRETLEPMSPHVSEQTLSLIEKLKDKIDIF